MFAPLFLFLPFQPNHPPRLSPPPSLSLSLSLSPYQQNQKKKKEKETSKPILVNGRTKGEYSSINYVEKWCLIQILHFNLVHSLWVLNYDDKYFAESCFYWQESEHPLFAAYMRYRIFRPPPMCSWTF